MLQEEAMNAASAEYSVENSPFGRVLVARDVPDRFALFYTTRDFHGRLTEGIAHEIASYIHGRFGIQSSLATCTQVHGKSIRRAPHADVWRECDSCDALWSDAPHITLGIKVADCLPVTMIDPVHDVIANIHSGWRGAVQRITSETIDAIEQSTKFESRDAHAYLGPSIRVCCFEVGEEVAAQFDESFIDRTHEKPHVDLVAMTIGILRSRGFRDDRIHDSRACTRCDGSIFHSYRRDSKGGGRNLALAAH